MKEVPENELLSAYLDGELTAEEQAEVEKLLVASPAARQLVDELRALSSSLQALPAHQIGEDISQQVLRLAEQRKLDPRAAAEGPKEAGEQPEVPVWRAMVRRFARPRNWAWAGVAVAVALLLMFMQPDELFEPVGREIAMDTVAEDAPRAASQPAATMEAGEAADAEMVAEYPAEAEPSLSEMRRGRGDFVAGKAGPGEAMSAPAPAGPAPATAPAPRAALESAIAEPAEAPAPVGADEDPFGGMGLGRRVAKEGDAVEVQLPGSGRPSKDQPGFVMKKGEADAEVMGPESSTSAKADQPQPDGQRPEPALVVSCLAAPEAFREQTFERLLNEQGIRRVATAGADAQRARAPAAAAQRGQARSYGVRVGQPGLPQVVEVEATRDQLEGLLLSVQAQPDQFAFSDAAPGPGHLAVSGLQFRAGLDREPKYAAAEPTAEMAAEAVQQTLGRMDVDKLLGLLERATADDKMRRKAGIGVLADGQRPPADSAVQLRTAPGDAARRGRLTQQARQPKAGPGDAFAPDARPAGPGAARAAGVNGQRAAEREAPSLQPAMPREPVRKLPSETMEIQAEQSEADEEERVAKELPEEPGGRPSRPKPVRNESEKRFAEAKKAKQPGPPLLAEEPDRYVRTYRVRFVFHVVDRPGGVAASIAQEAASARMAEEPPAMLDAAAEPPAAAAPVVEEQR